MNYVDIAFNASPILLYENMYQYFHFGNWAKYVFVMKKSRLLFMNSANIEIRFRQIASILLFIESGIFSAI